MLIYIELWTIAPKYDWIHANTGGSLLIIPTLEARFIDGTFIRELNSLTKAHMKFRLLYIPNIRLLTQFWVNYSLLYLTTFASWFWSLMVAIISECRYNRENLCRRFTLRIGEIRAVRATSILPFFWLLSVVIRARIVVDSEQ